jgi:hypothetical protein
MPVRGPFLADSESTYINPPARNNHKADLSRVSKTSRDEPLAQIPEGFPHPYRLGTATLFRELLGRPGLSTFARYLATGQIPPPDKQLGGRNYWIESHMAASIGTLKVTQHDEKAVA